MDKDRDEILNELIKYYDGDEDAQTTPAEAPQGNMGDTIVIKKNNPVPVEETFGDTVVVNIKPKQAEASAKKVSDETTAIPVQTQKKAPEPVEEVLGNLDLEGKPIYSGNVPPAINRIEPSPDNQPRQRRNPSESNAQQEEHFESKKRTGIWYELKPLWATLIVCACLFLTLVLYFKGYVHTYIYNFSCNLELIFESLGIEYPGNKNSNNNPYPSVLASDTMISLNQSETGENYTERNNVREEAPSAYDSVKENKKLLPFEEAGNSDFSTYKNGVVCAKSNYICYINDSGEKEWEYSTSVSNPIVSTAGKYIAIASKDGTQINLYKDKKFVYSTDASNKIKSCKVSEYGDVVIITEKPAYKGAVVVINKKGEEVFAWSSGVNYITAASPVKGRKIAVTLADTSSRITSFIMVFDIKSPDPVAGVGFSDTLVYNVSYVGKVIYAAGDNSIVSAESDGEVNYDMRFNDVCITRSVIDHKGNTLLTFTQEHLPAMNIYNKKGELIHSSSIECSPDYVDLYESTVLYNNGRDVICGNLNDEKKTAYTAPMTIKDLVLINKNTYVIVYENTLEFIGI